ncbi:ADP-ribosylation factor GTPase activating protein 3 [Rhodnius prolixus]|uniref:Putative gtpase-activating protein n=2 Tax=Rhodnius TaxID=13248 RepID=R4G8T1_RHOPR
MAESMPTKKDIEYLFKKLRSVQTNKVCFDCTAKNPTWASVTYGVFICIDCSAVHRSLGVHLTFVRSTQLDTNWTWIQLRQMQLGGNANAESFFHQHNCTTKDSQQKYTSRAAQLYKDKLHNAALQAIRINGPKIQFDHDCDSHPASRDKGDFDFFDEHSQDSNNLKENVHNPNNNFSSVTGGVTAAATSQSSTASQPKHIIGSRKANPKRTGIGCRKGGGLGAQKITTNFADIEKEAQQAGEMKEEANRSISPTPETESEQIASLRLVYEDLSLRQKQEEVKIKAVDALKAKQMERLGMGFTGRSEVSHSALSDMKTIQQENVSKQKTERDDDDFFELDFSLSSNLTSEFLNSRNSSESKNITSLFGVRKEPKSTSFSDDISQKIERKRVTVPGIASSNEAQKKFGSAKSISSDQFFSDNSDSAWERSANLSRFEGSSSISSADYFNRNESMGRHSGASGSLIPGNLINAPDLDDVRESVRQGVTKVAGRLSSLANGVMSTIQEKYGGY